MRLQNKDMPLEVGWVRRLLRRGGGVSLELGLEGWGGIWTYGMEG